MSLITNDTFTEDTIYIKIYKECWTKCQETFQIDSNGGEAMKELASGAFNQERHRNYCRHYNTSRECANECTKGQKDHHYYLRPFFRRNYLNEFICFKHYEEFHKSIPCYLAGDVIKSFYNRCGSEFVDDDDAVEASDQTCDSLKCLLKQMPNALRVQCDTQGHEEQAFAAGQLLQRSVAAQLRERIRLHHLTQFCGIQNV
ncbi:hypothetical protein WR25_05103 [Diploscapter pachys]|uniref:Chondroitin proteoglycan 4 domain-containing protein n=1 Tax=Diploscapter pachys TaxID=2018661 RepID=A0A2A2J7Q6_9BILA|nr:hypothetical protein WR25_05103 [Diploscapter pachys]